MCRLVCVMAVLSWLLVSSQTLPPYVQVCYRQDPRLASCLKRAIETIVPTLKGGSRDFELEPLDPLDFQDLVFSFRSPMLGGRMSVPRSILEGITNFKVLDVRPISTTKKNMVLEFDILMPHLTSRTDYDLDGYIFSRPVQLSGNVEIEFFNLTLTYHLEGNVQTVDRDDYLVLQSFYWRLHEVQQVEVKNTDVVEGRPMLSRVVAALLRSAWGPLISTMVPAILPRTDASLRDMFSSFFMKYPYDVIFPKHRID